MRLSAAALLGFCLGLFLFVPERVAHARELSPLELMDGERLLERQISDHYRSLTATVLQPDTYEISTQVFLEKTAESPAKSPPAGGPPLGPDMTLGLVEADQVLRRYEEEIAQLKEVQSSSTYPQWFRDYHLKSVRVMLGVKEPLDDAQKTDVEKWLKERVNAEFGALGEAVVSRSLRKEAPGAAPKTWLDRIIELQRLLSFIALGAAIVATLVLWKIMGSKDAAEERRLTMELNQKKTELGMSDDENEEEEEPASAPSVVDNSNVLDNRLKLLIENIISISGKLGSETHAVFNSWLDAGTAGYLKLACLVQLGAARDIAGVNATGFSFDHRDGLVSAMREVRKKGREDQINILEEVYTDLIVARMFGERSLKRPFSYVSRVSEETVSSILMNQNPMVRSLVVLHMPMDSRRSYFAAMNPADKLSVLSDIFLLEQSDPTTINQVDTELKSAFESSGGKARNVVPLLPEIINSLSALESISLLRGLAKTGASERESFKEFKRNYLTVAFMEEWPDEKCAMLFESATAEELVTLIQTAPELKDKVIRNCPSMLARMVESNLEYNQKSPEPEQIRHMESLREKLVELSTKGLVTLKDLYDKKRTEAPLQTAA